MHAFLFSGAGRLDRLGYLLALLTAGLLFCVPLAMLLPSEPTARLRALGPAYQATVGAVGTMAWITVLWIYCAATARRLHDLNRSGWLALLALLPAVGLGALTVVLLTFPGKPGTNRYGARWL